MTASRRIPELEGIRGILSLLVVSGHVYSPAIPWYPGSMDFFFCISGFLITRIILNAPAISLDFLKKYAARRALRIWPMYYFSLLLYFAASCTVLAAAQVQWHQIDTGWDFSWTSVFMHVFFVQNTEVLMGLPRVDSPFLFAHSWSVAVEEQFYFLWPLLLLSRPIWTARFAWILAGLACITAVVARGAGYVEFDADAVAMCLLPSRLDSFAAGITLAFLLRSATDDLQVARMRRIFGLMTVLGLAMLIPSVALGYGAAWVSWIPVLLRTIFDPPLGFSVLAFGSIGLVVLKSGSSLLSPLRNPFLMHLGAISYSTYLLHIAALVAISMLMDSYGLNGIVLQWVLSLALAIGISHLTYRHIEMRALALKSRFRYENAT